MTTHSVRDSLLAVSPLDGRYRSKVEALRPIFSEFGLIRYRVQVEVEWLIFLSEHPGIEELEEFPKESKETLRRIYGDFTVDDALGVKAIEEDTNHDVKAVEYFLRERCAQLQVPYDPEAFIHFACTSEDINNLSHGLMLKHGVETLVVSMEEIIERTQGLAVETKTTAMLARTHGQAASPTTLGKEMFNFQVRLGHQLDKIREVDVRGKFNGATGNFNAHLAAYPDIDWMTVSKEFVERVGLTWNPHTTQIEPHDYIAELLQAIARFNVVLLDFNRDVWGYIALGYFGQRIVGSEVGSSTMPHKVNPIDFENSEGNLGVANALMHHLSEKLPISRWQRDLSDSTVLRNLGVVLAHSLLAYQSTIRGMKRLEPHADRIEADLSDSWPVLAEAIQTVMRRYRVPEPYEKLKALTRGKGEIGETELRDFVESLEIPDQAKSDLLSLTPGSYTGNASEQLDWET